MADLKKDSKELAEKLFRQINYFGNGLDKAISEQIQKEHRTLQASMIRCFRDVLCNYAKWHEENPQWHDARNEGAIEFSKAVAKIDVSIPYI